MNIFRTQGDILGCRKEETHKNSLESFFSYASQLRRQLGRKGYLLDTYFSIFFDAVNNTIAVVAADDGFQAAGEYKSLCDSILQSPDVPKDSPLYMRILETLKEHSFISSFQEPYTQKALLYCFTADMMLSESVDKYVEQLEISISHILDIVQFRDIFEQVSMLVGEQSAEELNVRLKQAFLVTQVIPIYTQAFVNSLLLKLTWRDSETSRQVFQLILDNMPE